MINKMINKCVKNKKKDEQRLVKPNGGKPNS
jgi:hypothetical protein